MLALAAAVLLRWKLAEHLVRPAWVGVFAAWAVSTASVAALLAFRGRSFESFLWAFGGGVLLRMAVLAGMMAVVWGERYEVQAALLGSYAAGILVLLTTEYRQLSGK
ncbi:MAG: hypothetical protein ABIJ96_06975 [Elusimicrobiota bacterium]